MGTINSDPSPKFAVPYTPRVAKEERHPEERNLILASNQHLMDSDSLIVTIGNAAYFNFGRPKPATAPGA